MNIDFSDREVLFIYGRIKKEFVSMKEQKAIRYSKSDLKIYEDLIGKMEKAYPALIRLPF